MEAANFCDEPGLDQSQAIQWTRYKFFEKSIIGWTAVDMGCAGKWVMIT